MYAVRGGILLLWTMLVSFEAIAQQRIMVDTARARALFMAGDSIAGSDTALALTYHQQGLRLAGDDPFYTGLGYFYLGRLYMDDDPQRGAAAFNKAISLLEKRETPLSWHYQSRAWANLGVIAQGESDDRKFTDIILNKAIPLAMKSGDSAAMARGYTNLAISFLNAGNHAKAILYSMQSIRIYQRNQAGEPRQIDNFTNLAKIYIEQQAYQQARNCLDSAHAYVMVNPGSLYAPYYYSINAQYFINTNDFKQATFNIDEGLAATEKLNNHHYAQILLYQKARLMENLHHITAARDILLKMYREYSFTAADRRQLYHDLSGLEAELSHPADAYQWLKKYVAISDSLNETATRIQIAGLETKYNLAQKEKELLVIRGHAKTQQMIIWGVVLVLIPVLLFFIYFYKTKKLRAEQAVQSLQQQQRTALTQALLQGEEKERSRMARDLHDGLGGTLAAVKLNLTNALRDNPVAEMKKVIVQLDDSVSELRRIARNMMPEALLRSGLETAITDLCGSLSGENLQVDFSAINLRTDIPKPTQIIIYRIIQELLTNVIKHAEATEALVQCSQEGPVVYITVEDNGKGMDTAVAAGKRGIGLDNIQNRVEFLKGKMECRSSVGKGTIINIELHVDENN
ncbi:ATP-binding protein [Chitinophaga sp.]|uniref:tetratricopeptide repeat-containing sensor histidine kinase n=1 Tax=Chitinophaga sp. TaxID=1869181 RepID=UPI0031D5FADF